MQTVNFGIDLGTTNSLIAKYHEGVHQVFNNPMGQKQTLASAVAFRGNRILVGDKARDLLEKDPLNVFTCFKRKMGTTDRYFVKSLQKDISPIELSAFVLKELRNFVHTGETFEEAVITIPSSFDTIQSNATKTAGKEAGFKNVFLLQEPIAASLAFANEKKLSIEEEKKWLIYDFGGGTFDVALLQINQREMKVLDNEGDNFLGGMDLDNLIIEKLLIPELEKAFEETNLWDKFKKPGNPYQKLYFELLFRAEEAKKELSRFESTEIDIDFPEKDIYTSIEIKRDDFNALLAPLVTDTINFAHGILERNNLSNTDIERIIMVGGSTLIPYVQQRVENDLKIKIDTSVDPTAAVGIGAAYYAGTKASTITETAELPSSKDGERSSNLEKQRFEIFYEKNTKDLEELVAITVEDGFEGYYRIMRKDGGFDSGLVSVEGNINCFVDLTKGEINIFELQILDKDQQIIHRDTIKIHQGKYNVQGQLLPNDICLEIDDLQYHVTRLEAIFKKNSVLPLRKTLYKSASKTILKGSEDKIQINIVEGDDNGLPSSGLSIGYIEISGKELEDDLIKGTDIELDIALSESRDIDITVFLAACEQEFTNTFRPTERYISSSKMENEMRIAVQNIEKEFKKNSEDYHLMAKFNKIREALLELQIELSLLMDDDVTDAKFKIDNQKRALVKEYDGLTRHKDLNSDIDEYHHNLKRVKYELRNGENEFFQSQLDQITKDERTVLNSGNKYMIRAKIEELESLISSILASDDSNFVSPFLYYKSLDEYPDQSKADKLILEGEKALDKGQYSVVKHVVYQLAALLPKDKKRDGELGDQDKTGLR